MSTIINLEGVSVSYDNKRVLSNIYLPINEGHLYGVIGPNGAGKSTLFKAILDLVDINAGEVRFVHSSLEEKRKKIAYVPQKDDVDWSFPATVNDVVMMGRYPHKTIFSRMNQNDQSIVDKALDDMDILDLKNRQIGELSGGQQQRTFIARALAQEADIFFLDEPFVGVDITTEEKIIDLLKNLVKDNKTVLVIHHDLSTVNKYFDQVILLNKRLVATGNTQSTFTTDNIARTYGAQSSILYKTEQL